MYKYVYVEKVGVQDNVVEFFFHMKLLYFVFMKCEGIFLDI